MKKGVLFLITLISAAHEIVAVRDNFIDGGTQAASNEYILSAKTGTLDADVFTQFSSSFENANNALNLGMANVNDEAITDRQLGTRSTSASALRGAYLVNTNLVADTIARSSSMSMSARSPQRMIQKVAKESRFAMGKMVKKRSCKLSPANMFVLCFLLSDVHLICFLFD